jgi:PIN domain nuclease of toxin-antitoxin system
MVPLSVRSANFEAVSTIPEWEYAPDSSNHLPAISAFFESSSLRVLELTFYNSISKTPKLEDSRKHQQHDTPGAVVAGVMCMAQFSNSRPCVHAVWLASTAKELSPPPKRTIQGSADNLCFSSISALEIAILAKRKRLILPLGPAEFIDRALKQHGIHEIPFDRSIAVASTCLPDIHSDPFDGIIIATAQLNGMSIVSRDRLLQSYPGVRIIW